MKKKVINIKISCVSFETFFTLLTFVFVVDENRKLLFAERLLLCRYSDEILKNFLKSNKWHDFYYIFTDMSWIKYMHDNTIILIASHIVNFNHVKYPHRIRLMI